MFALVAHAINLMSDAHMHIIECLLEHFDQKGWQGHYSSPMYIYDHIFAA